MLGKHRMSSLIQRERLHQRLVRSLRDNRITALVGPRQCGKTWLSRQVADHYFDADSPYDQARLSSNPVSLIADLEGVVVIDEVQQMPELFPALRVLADQPFARHRLLITGSASPELLGLAAHRLTGRVSYLPMHGFHLAEVGSGHASALWWRGGFPLAYLAEDEERSAQWRRDFIQSYLVRELPALADLRATAQQAHRFLTMLAYNHGQLRDKAELAKDLQMDVRTVGRYLDVFAGAYLIRVLPAFYANLGKRLIKTPKIFLRDSGLLHALLRIPDRQDWSAHPGYGASWEGFAMDQVIRHLGAVEEDCFFYQTRAGGEVDLVVRHGPDLLGFEFKVSDRPSTTRSMHTAVEELGLRKLWVVHPGRGTFPLSERIQALGFAELPLWQPGSTA